MFLQMIPETHQLPGAVKIKDYRSFGFNRMDVVKTYIYVEDEDGKKTLYSRLKQIYCQRL